MNYRAIMKKSGDWWIGWLIDLPMATIDIPDPAWA